MCENNINKLSYCHVQKKLRLFFLSKYLLSVYFGMVFAKDPIDVIIPSIKKDVVTLNLAIDGIRKNCKEVRRIIVVSPEKLTDKAEWFPESGYPFTSADIKKEINNGKRNVANCTGAGWVFQQFLKLYAPLVIPDLVDTVLILDSDVIFLNTVDFQDDIGSYLYASSGEYHQEYFNHAKRLMPDFARTFPLSGITHHMIFRKSILNNFFKKIVGATGLVSWRVLARSIDPSSAANISEYELYYNFAAQYDHNFKMRQLRWINASEVNEIETYKKLGFHYVAFHSWLRNNLMKPNIDFREHATCYNCVLIDIGGNLRTSLIETVSALRLNNNFCNIYLVANMDFLNDFKEFLVEKHVISINSFLLPMTVEKIQGFKESSESFSCEAVSILYNLISFYNLEDVFLFMRNCSFFLNFDELSSKLHRMFEYVVDCKSDNWSDGKILYVRDKTAFRKFFESSELTSDRKSFAEKLYWSVPTICFEKL